MKPASYQSGLSYGYGYGDDSLPKPTPEQQKQLDAIAQQLPKLPEAGSEIVTQAREYTSFCGDQSVHRIAESVLLASSVVLPTLLGFAIGIPFGRKGRFALYGFGLGAIRGAFYAYTVKQAIKARCGE